MGLLNEKKRRRKNGQVDIKKAFDSLEGYFVEMEISHFNRAVSI